MEQLKTTQEINALADKRKLHGAYQGIPSDVYHASAGLSRSEIVMVATRSVQHMYTQREERQKGATKDTPELLFGRALHSAFLEPEIFGQAYAVMPKFDRRTKIGKENHAIWLGEHPSKTALTENQFQRISQMCGSLGRHKVLSQIVKQCKTETSYYAYNKESGALFKGRADISGVYVDDQGRDLPIIVDLKSTIDASPSAFRRSVVKYFYDAQAYFYLNVVSKATGIDYKTYAIAAVEKEPPFGCALYYFGEADLEVGGQIIEAGLKKYQATHKEEQTTSYPQGLQLLGLPAYGFDIESRIN